MNSNDYFFAAIALQLALLLAVSAKYIRRNREMASMQYETERIKIEENLIVGSKFADFPVRLVDGSINSLAAIKSRRCLLLFFSPDCPHCFSEIPSLLDTRQKELNDMEIHILLCSLGNRLDTIFWRNKVKNEKNFDITSKIILCEFNNDFFRYSQDGILPVFVMIEEDLIKSMGVLNTKPWFDLEKTLSLTRLSVPPNSNLRRYF